jgi:hypothetical protein
LTPRSPTRSAPASWCIPSITPGQAAKATAGWGQNYLAAISDATGGAAYWPARGGAVLFDGFLNDLNSRLRNQYLLTLTPGDLKPRLEALTIKSGNPDVSLVAPKQIWLARQPE